MKRGTNKAMTECGASARTDRAIAAFFDRCAHQGLMHDFEPGEVEKLSQFLHRWELKPGMRVLEPGCGAGRLTRVLAEVVGPTGEVCAIDLSRAMLRAARCRRLPAHVSLHCASAERVPRPDGWFDAVICLNVFPHFLRPDRVLAEFRRVLAPGGRLWIAHFEGRRRLNRFHRFAAPEVREHQLPPRRSMLRLLRDAGFDCRSIDDTDERYLLEAVRIAWSTAPHDTLSHHAANG